MNIMSRKTIGIISVIIVALVLVGLVVSNDFLGLSGQVVEPDESRILFDEYVQTFSELLQYEFDVFLDDDVISQDEVNQINFLKQFTLGEQISFIKSGNHTDFDWDKDNMDNYFEKEIAELPYDLYNGRYAILVDTFEDTDTSEYMHSFLVNEQRFNPQNIRKLAYVNATIENFEKSVSDFKQVIDRDCLLYVMLEGHGNTYGLAFNDGKGNTQGVGTLIFFENIGKILEPITSNSTVISIFCCGSEGALNSLKITNSSTVVIPHMAADWFFATSKNFSNSYIQCLPTEYDPIEIEAYDIDENGYVTIGESLDAQMKSVKRYLDELPTEAFKFGISDPNNISHKIYFGDFCVRNQENIE